MRDISRESHPSGADLTCCPHTISPSTPRWSSVLCFKWTDRRVWRWKRWPKGATVVLGENTWDQISLQPSRTLPSRWKAHRVCGCLWPSLGSLPLGRILQQEADLSRAPKARGLPPAAQAGGKRALNTQALHLKELAPASHPAHPSSIWYRFNLILLYSWLFLACVWHFKPMILFWQNGPRGCLWQVVFKIPRIVRMGTAVK